MTIKQISRSARTLALASLVVVGACFDDEPTDMLSPNSQADATLSVKVSDVSARVGDHITVAVEATSSAPLSGVQGFLRFDPKRLSFAGQIADHDAIVVINESAAARGEIRLVSFSATALAERIAKFAFEVRDPSYANAIRFDAEVVGDLKAQEVRVKVSREVTLDAQLPGADKAVHWNYMDWAVFADPSIADEANAIKTNIAGLPTNGTVYGDANLSGGINVLNASDVSNTAVGNREVIIGTTANDRVTAANVRPLASGACLAGFSGTDCATRVINVLDVSPISQESVGTDALVVGNVIPLPKSTYTATDSVFIPGSTCGGSVITGTRTFRRDSVYVITGCPLRVGLEAGAAGELVIESGTLIEGDTLSAIFITRNGRIISNGTPTQPITFTCRGLKKPACWGGLFIAGNAVVNEQDATLGGVTAPAIPGRNPTGGQNQRAGEGGAVNHGGGNDADSSGVIRYTRLMYGGRILTGNNELNDLTIGSCGSRTVLDHIQVHGGTDDGLEIFGGRCNVKYLYASANDDDQFDYSFGYDGSVQFLIVQHARVAVNTGDKGFEVDNTETTATYNNTPSTNPQVFNVTQIGGALGSGSTHLHYRRGSSSTVRNVLLVNGANALLIDDAPTCANGLTINNIVKLSVTNWKGAASTAVCLPIGPDSASATYTSQLKDPFNQTLPDFRPTGNGVTLVPAATPPSNGFFDTTATFIGAVLPVGLDFGSIPWYAGWTLPWQAPGII